MSHMQFLPFHIHITQTKTAENVNLIESTQKAFDWALLEEQNWVEQFRMSFKNLEIVAAAKN